MAVSQVWPPEGDGVLARGSPNGALKLLREIRSMRVLVIHPQDRNAEELVAHLRRIGCRVSATWPPPEELPEDVQIVFRAIHPPDSDYGEMMKVAGPQPPITIGIVEYENPTILQSVIDAEVVAIVAKPVRAIGLLTTIMMSVTVTKRERDLAKRLGKIEQKLSALKRIERAKAILMDRNGVSEEEAYSSIRAQAMARRVSIDEISVAIINASEIFADSSKRSGQK